MDRLGFFILILTIYACSQSDTVYDKLGLQDKLSISWEADAFDGALHESWVLGSDGCMQQHGYYIENGDTSYSAITRIEKVGNDIVLYSVIKDSNPKIFKANVVEERMLVFENKGYKNPYEVKYEFITDDNHRRTITGYEQDSLVSYIFDFNKRKP